MPSEINKKSLSKADYSFSSPFFLALPDQQESVACEEIARIIPGKRLVAFGTWNKHSIVAKIFFGPKAKQRMERDRQGAQALLAARIPSPLIHYHGETRDPSVFVIVFERIANAQNLGSFWEAKKTSPESEPVLHSLTIELATQHVLGLLQKDLHLNNFLLTPEKIYTLDGADILTLNEPVSKKQSIENLALLFSQLGIYTNKLQERLFHAYINARSWLIEKADLQQLQKAIHQWNISRWLSYRKKIFRSSTQFSKTKKLRRYSLYDRNYDSPLFQKFLQNPDAFFTLPETLLLKDGRSSTVARVTLDKRHFVVKRYNMKDFWHQLKRCLQPSRAELSWHLSHQLQFAGLPTAKPVAFIEKRFLNFRGKSYFIMEYIEGTRADHFFEQYPANSRESLVIAKRIIALFFNLARLKLSHGDLKITNIILNANQEPVLIDLDSMREHKSSLGLSHRFRKDMLRLLENWRSNPAMHQLFNQLIGEMMVKKARPKT